MAVLKGPLKIIGKLGALSYYEENGEIKVRERCGHNKNKIKNNPRYWLVKARTSEFGTASRFASAIIRCAKNTNGGNGEYTFDRLAISRVTQFLRPLLSYSNGENFGERTICNALKDPKSQTLLRNYHLNNDHRIPQSILESLKYDFDKALLTVNLSPHKLLFWPKGLKKVLFTLSKHKIKFDAFSRGEMLIQRSTWSLVQGEPLSDFELQVNKTTETGVTILILLGIQLKCEPDVHKTTRYKSGKWDLSKILDIYNV